MQEVGAKLAAVSDRSLPYEFAVINNSTPNAWALPGGKIAINRGLLTELDSEAELAAVLGMKLSTRRPDTVLSPCSAEHCCKPRCWLPALPQPTATMARLPRRRKRRGRFN